MWIAVVGAAVLLSISVVALAIQARDGVRTTEATRTAVASTAAHDDAPPGGTRGTNVRSMVPPGSRVKNTLYPDLDGDGVADIVVLALRPTGGSEPQPYVRAFIWHDGDWRTAFNALLDAPDVTNVPAAFLSEIDGPSAQSVIALGAWDADGDGDDELSLVTRQLGDSRRRIWLLTFPDRNAHVAFFAEVEGKISARGGEVVMSGRLLSSTDGSCCESRGGSYVAVYDDQLERFVITTSG
jgi:hypothetical protein